MPTRRRCFLYCGPPFRRPGVAAIGQEIGQGRKARTRGQFSRRPGGILVGHDDAPVSKTSVVLRIPSTQVSMNFSHQGSVFAFHGCRRRLCQLLMRSFIVRLTLAFEREPLHVAQTLNGDVRHTSGVHVRAFDTARHGRVLGQLAVKPGQSCRRWLDGRRGINGTGSRCFNSNTLL